jgi:hypothetical protein
MELMQLGLNPELLTCELRIADAEITAYLMDGRTVSVPLA